MFSTLLETRPVRARTRSAVVISFVVHVALAGTAIAATKAEFDEGNVDAPPPPDIVYVQPAPKPVPQQPQPAAPAPPAPTDPAPAPAPLPPIPAPTEVPNGIPPVDPNAATTVEPTFGPTSPIGSSVIGNQGEPVSGPIGGAYTYDEVEEAVRPIGRQREPRYPEILRNGRIEGAVTVVFVVDSLGRVEEQSFKVIESSHAAFDAAVRQAVLGQRFRPAKWRGGHVRQLVQQRFVFALSR